MYVSSTSTFLKTITLSNILTLINPNGTGKSTLLNMITDKLTPLRGSISRNGRLRIGIFTQHSGDKFDLQLSAVENMLNLFPTANVSDQDMRSFIGKFQLQGEEVLKPMMMLSGGQKSRLAFAALAYQRPHVIIMDEPTNHREYFYFLMNFTIISTFASSPNNRRLLIILRPSVKTFSFSES